MTYQNLTIDKTQSQFADDTALWAASKNVQFASKLLRKDLRKLAKWCAKWRIKLNPEKTKVIIFSRSSLARNSEPILKLYCERLKIYPQVKFLGITFDSRFTLQNTLRTSWSAVTPGTTQSDYWSTRNGDPARPPYYKSINNLSGQFWNMAPFRPAKFNGSRTNLSGLP